MSLRPSHSLASLSVHLALFVASFAVACSSDDDESRADFRGSSEELEAARAGQITGESPGGEVDEVDVDDSVVDKSGLSIVQFCDKPNSSDGTVCRGQGCSTADSCAALDTATIAECRGDVTAVCGSPTPVFVLITGDGFRFEL